MTRKNYKNLAKDENIKPCAHGEWLILRNFEIEVANLKAATAEANKRIKALEGEVANLQLNIKAQEQLGYELQANNHDFREALEKVKAQNDKYGKDGHIDHVVVNALYSTPAESLQAFENEVIEKCAKVCDRFIKQEHEDGNSATALMLVQDYIRALKQK